MQPVRLAAWFCSAQAMDFGGNSEDNWGGEIDGIRAAKRKFQVRWNHAYCRRCQTCTEGAAKTAARRQDSPSACAIQFAKAVG
jgi:hypothetical protein